MSNNYRPIYTLGYSGSSMSSIQHYLDYLEALLVDIRYSPTSRNPMWRGASFRRALGDRYRQVRQLGNENYKGGPMKIHRPEEGSAAVQDLLVDSSVILMCACSDLDRCHRKPVATSLGRQFGVEVFHLPARFEAFIEQE